jgi:tetratricopeptide (TPR) repeat protein
MAPADDREEFLRLAAQASGSDGARARALMDLGTHLLRQPGRVADACDVLDDAVRNACRDGEPRLVVAARMLRGRAGERARDLDAARHHMEAALDEVSRLGEPGEEGRVRLALGGVFHHGGDDGRATAHARAAATCFASARDRAGQARAVALEALAGVRAGDWSQARDLFAQAIGMAQHGGEPVLEAELHEVAASAERKAGDLAAARAHHEAALEGWQGAAMTAAETKTRLTLGQLSLLLDDTGAAQRHLERALVLATEDGNGAAVLEAHQQLGEVARAVSDFDAAERHFRTVLDHARSPKLVARAEEGMAAVAAFRNRLDDAKALLADAAGRYGRAGERAGAVDAEIRLALFDRLSGDTTAAVKRLREVLGQAEESGYEPGVLHASGALADALLAQDEVEDAAALFGRQLQLARRLGDVLAEGQALLGMGRVAMRHSDVKGATTAFTDSLQCHEIAGQRLGIAAANEWLGRARLAADDLEPARERLAIALEVAQAAHDVRAEASARRGLGEVALASGDLHDAGRQLDLALTLHQRAQDLPGEADDLLALGRYSLVGTELDVAEAYGNAALAAYRRLEAHAGATDAQLLLSEINQVRLAYRRMR